MSLFGIGQDARRVLYDLQRVPVRRMTAEKASGLDAAKCQVQLP